MPCYGVDTLAIERLSERIQGVSPEIFELNSETAIAFEREHDKLLREIEELFLAAFFCFLQVMLSIARARLQLERRRPPLARLLWWLLTGSRSRPRDYLEGFLPIYEQAARRSEEQLRSLFEGAFAQIPGSRAVFVEQLIASQTAEEMRVFATYVRPGEYITEVDEHGDAGKKVTDSVKDLLKSFFGDSRFGRLVFKKESVERGLHAINEIIGIVFRGAA